MESRESTYTISSVGKKEVKAITVSSGDLQSEQGIRIARKNISAGFVGYVMTDEFKMGVATVNQRTLIHHLLPIPSIVMQAPFHCKKIQCSLNT